MPFGSKIKITMETESVRYAREKRQRDGTDTQTDSTDGLTLATLFFHFEHLNTSSVCPQESVANLKSTSCRCSHAAWSFSLALSHTLAHSRALSHTLVFVGLPTLHQPPSLFTRASSVRLHTLARGGQCQSSPCLFEKNPLRLGGAGKGRSLDLSIADIHFVNKERD